MANTPEIHQQETVSRPWIDPDARELEVRYRFQPPVSLPAYYKGNTDSLSELTAIACLGDKAQPADIANYADSIEAAVSEQRPYAPSPGDITVRLNQLLAGTEYIVSLPG